MMKSLVLTLAALAVACAIAWRLGGSLGAGVVAGFTCGASVAGFGAAWQRHTIRRRPDRLLAAVVGSFLAKLVVVLVLALALRFVGGLAERVDWRSFLVTFASAVFLVMLLGAVDNARALQTPRRAVETGGTR